MLQLMTDYLFTCPSRRFLALNNHTQAGQWQYFFNHSLSFPGWGPYYYCQDYACHGAELPFIFNSVTDVGFNFTTSEQQLAYAMSSYWTVRNSQSQRVLMSLTFRTLRAARRAIPTKAAPCRCNGLSGRRVSYRVRSSSLHRQLSSTLPSARSTATTGAWCCSVSLLCLPGSQGLGWVLALREIK